MFSTRRQTLLRILIVITAFLSAGVHAQTILAGSAAFLFSYFPKDGMTAEFNAGYQAHLEWHRERQDPFPWYGWYVIWGKRLGLFIDGTFGISFEDFDNRIDPRGDAADANKTFSPYAIAKERRALRLRKDLSTAIPLEEMKPTPMVEAHWITLKPGSADAFATLVLPLTQALRAREDQTPFTFYELVSGGEHDTYLLMVGTTGFGGFDAGANLLPQMAKRLLDAKRGDKWIARYQALVTSHRSEIWRYSANMSLLPK